MLYLNLKNNLTKNTKLEIRMLLETYALKLDTTLQCKSEENINNYFLKHRIWTNVRPSLNNTINYSVSIIYI